MSELSPTPKTRKRRTAPRKKVERRIVPASQTAFEVPTLKGVEEYVRREPLRALAGAALAGLILPRLPLTLLTMLAGAAIRFFGKTAKPSILAIASAETVKLFRDQAPEPKKGRKRSLKA